jgi:hydrogenase nickel incorporation protein HypB
MMFRAADVVLFTKSDLLPVLDDFDPEQAEWHLRNLASQAPVIRLSARRNLNLTAWFDWLISELAQQRAKLDSASSRSIPAPAGPISLHTRAPG